MRALMKSLRLSVKIALLGVGSVLMTAGALVTLAVWQSGQYNTLAQLEVDTLIDADLDHITQGVYNLVQTENEAVQYQVNYNLNVAGHVLANTGEVGLLEETVDWSATNQFTNESRRIQLPKMTIGNQWLGQIRDPAIETRVVDEVTRLIGETATIFQRMNAEGDMLRVATTVMDTAGTRAIGTFVPAVNCDGSLNPVVATVLKRKTYRGRAFVVDSWYLTAYEPIKDLAGNVVGMLYVGTKQKDAEARVRQAILNTKVGKTGYVYVLGGKGEERGRYIISHKGERDGEDIWQNKDSDGRYVIQAIIDKATVLQHGELATERYRWQNPGERTPRWKVARLAYFEPWDWVIGTSVYEDELQAYRAILSGGRMRMTRTMGLAGLMITGLIGLLSLLIAWTITHPIGRMTRVVERITSGELDQAVDVYSNDEFGTLARAFNFMTQKLSQIMEGLHKSEEKYRGIFEHALEGIFQTSFDGRFLSANPAMARMLGYDSPAALIAGVTDIRQQLYVHPEERDAIVATLREIGAVLDRECQWYCKNKSAVWVSISARAERDEAGELASIHGFVTAITDRKQAEAALQESEARYRRLVETMNEGLAVSDPDARITFVNERFCKMLQYSRDEILGHRIDEFILEESREVIDAQIARRKKGEAETYELAWKTKGGETIYTLVSPRGLFDERESYLGSIGVLTDITRRKRAEEEFLNNVHEMQWLMKSMANAFVVWETIFDEGGKLTDIRFSYFNDAYEKASGLKLVQVQGKTVREVWPATEQSWFDIYGEVALTGDSQFFAMSHASTQGLYACTAYRPWDTPDRICCVFEDITARKQAEDALRRSEQEKAILNEIAGVFLTVPDHEIYAEVLTVVVRVMKSAYGLFGFIAENGDLVMPSMSRGIWAKCEVPEKSYMFPPHTWGESLWGRAIREKKSFCSTGPFHTPEGHVLVENFLTVPIVFADKTIGLLCCANKPGGYLEEDKVLLERIAVNISPILSARLQRDRQERERTHLEAQLVQAQKLEAIGTLAGGIAHDFNNILMAIQGRASLMLLHEGDESPYGEDLRAIEGLVARAADLTKQLLGFARGGKYEVKVTDLNELISKNSEIFGRTKKEVKIHRRFAEGLWMVKVDRGQIEQVLLNLYVNAWQAMPGGGELYLQTENVVLDETYVKPFKVTRGNYIKVTVTDTGVGMDEETQQRIFEPFFTTREFGRGTGLGLAMVYGIVKNHGGIINVYSEQGHGTTFTIYLPASGTDVTGEEQASAEIVRGEGTILLIDDEEMIREVGVRILEALGYRVIAAGSGDEAMEVYRERSGEIDLAIVDMIMPGVSGGAVFDRLRGINPKVKVLLASGYSLNGEARGILERGCDGFIQKPFDVRVLSRKVREIMDKKGE
jgi:PAS domain S-box-containing protein